MNKRIQVTLALLCGAALITTAGAAEKLRGLYITGGCCHDYTRQQDILPQGVSARLGIEWTIVDEGGRGTKHDKIENSIYNKPDWAKGYDVVVHNECFASDVDPA